MNFLEAIKSVFSNYAIFSGRARRSEYWYFTLFNFIVSFILGYISSIVSLVWSLVLFIPGLAVGVRRLHDIGKSGKYYLAFMLTYLLFSILSVVSVINYSEGLVYVTGALGIIILIMAIVIIIWFCKDSEPGTNQYGPNPKLPDGRVPEDTYQDNYNPQTGVKTPFGYKAPKA